MFGSEPMVHGIVQSGVYFQLNNGNITEKTKSLFYLSWGKTVKTGYLKADISPSVGHYLSLMSKLHLKVRELLIKVYCIRGDT